jgi:hypothetical protein
MKREKVIPPSLFILRYCLLHDEPVLSGRVYVPAPPLTYTVYKSPAKEELNDPKFPLSKVTLVN